MQHSDKVEMAVCKLWQMLTLREKQSLKIRIANEIERRNGKKIFGL